MSILTLPWSEWVRIWRKKNMMEGREWEWEAWKWVCFQSQLLREENSWLLVTPLSMPLLVPPPPTLLEVFLSISILNPRFIFSIGYAFMLKRISLFFTYPSISLSQILKFLIVKPWKFWILQPKLVFRTDQMGLQLLLLVVCIVLISISLFSCSFE